MAHVYFDTNLSYQPIQLLLTLFEQNRRYWRHHSDNNIFMFALALDIVTYPERIPETLFNE